MSDQNDQTNGNESNTTRPHPKCGYEPTKSLLNSLEWKAQIKESIKVKPLTHQEQLGPFYRANAPFRAKIGPPFEEGTVLIIKGRVWSSQERKGIPATMDVWHANSEGIYDNESGSSSGDLPFINRARVRCDDSGHFEFETIYPGDYARNEIWRAPHIHVRIAYSGHVPCITQLYFEGDEYLDVDPYVKDSLIVELTDKERNGKSYKEGEFEIVLATRLQNGRT